jgi:hypothetical protein
MQASNSIASTTTGPSIGADDGIFGLDKMRLDLPAFVGTFSQRLYAVGVDHAGATRTVPARAAVDAAGVAPPAVLHRALIISQWT